MSDELPAELVHTSESPVYHRLQDESHSDYELFTEYARIPQSSRTLENFSRRTSIPMKAARKMRDKWHWEVRANAFDHDSMMLRPDPRAVDEEAAIAGQLAAANIMLDLGLSVLSVRNPSLVPVGKAIKLVEKSVEIQRRALGQADLNVQFSVDDFSRVNKMIGEVIGVDDVEEEGMDDVPEVVDPGEDPDLVM